MGFFRGMSVMVEKISAITFRTANMKASVQFYRDVLGMELVYGGEGLGFSSLRAKDADSAILNLELGHAVSSSLRFRRTVKMVPKITNTTGIKRLLRVSETSDR
jgi:Glyoxalase/Bleomycin resistance protein/Dioxygenase superfamily